MFFVKKLRVAVCDDQTQICENYKIYISMREDMTCVGVANDSQSCIELVRNTKPDILLLDIQMETDISGLTILPQLAKASPKTKIVMISGHDNSEYIFLALVNGASGYVIKDVMLDKMFDRIYNIYTNNYSGDEIMGKFVSEAKNLYNARSSLFYVISQMVKLSRSEYDVLRDIYNGMTYREIANRRYVEEGTIKTLASRIIKKFEVSSMKEVISSLKEIRFFDNF